MVDGHLQAHGHLDYLFCNVGLPGVEPIEDLDEALGEHVIGVNRKGVYLMIRAAVPHMKQLGEAIVTTSSEAGLTGQPKLTAYCASKGGVVSMTRALALELVPFLYRCPLSTVDLMLTLLRRNGFPASSARSEPG